MKNKTIKKILFDILENNFFITDNTKNIVYINKDNTLNINKIEDYKFNSFINQFKIEKNNLKLNNLMCIDYDSSLREWDYIIRDLKNIILNL